MLKGHKFELDLDDEQTERKSAPLPALFVQDVLERKPATPTPPCAPTARNPGGFPGHRKRNVESRYKQRNVASKVETTSSGARASVSSSGPAQNVAGGKAKTWEEEDRERTDLENRQKIAQMSPDEIEEERRELMSNLSPALIQRLLQRADLNSGRTETDLSSQQEPVAAPEKTKSPTTKSVTFVEPTPEVILEDDATPMQGNDLENENEVEEAQPVELVSREGVHFPRPPQPPDLDPSSNTFLEDLHEKYFPSLPSDPEKLEWMQSSNSASSDYDPSAVALKPNNIRFSFTGELIPPRTASQIPVTAGLHHHGDAPDAAGYTISELVHLAHSTFAPQRCIAFQTLGRILYRLGKGEFGDSGESGAGTVGEEDTFGELARGLWRETEREKVVETLIIESEGRGVDRGKHVSAKAYATEAVWLWRKGGGRRWKAE